MTGTIRIAVTVFMLTLVGLLTIVAMVATPSVVAFSTIAALPGVKGDNFGSSGPFAKGGRIAALDP